MAVALIVPAVTAITSALYSIHVWHTTPYWVPIWWNLHGHAVQWAPKHLGLWTLPILQFLVPYVWYQVASRDVRFQQQRPSAKRAATYLLFSPAMFLFYVHNFVLLTSTETEFNHKIFGVGIGIWLLIWFGLHVDAIDWNSSIGVLMPQTIRYERCWKRVHRTASELFIVCGFILTFLSLFVPLGPLWLAMVLTFWIGPYVFLLLYSYWRHWNDMEVV